MHAFLKILATRGANCPRTAVIVPDLEALSCVPSGNCYLPEMSRICQGCCSWTGIIQSKEAQKYWLESLNHEHKFSFLHYAVRLSLRSKHWLENRGGAAALFAVFVGGALQDDHTKHAQKATKFLTDKCLLIFCPGNVSLEVGTYGLHHWTDINALLGTLLKPVDIRVQINSV